MLGVVTGVLRGARRGVMTGKQGTKSFYKGRGAWSTGYRTQKGKFHFDPRKTVHFVVPDLEGFELKPYVSYRAKDVGKVPPPSADDILELVPAPQPSEAEEEVH